MTAKRFNIIGWILLLAMIVLRIVYGYTTWQMLLVLAAFICFAISSGKIKKLKRLSLSQAIVLIVSFITAVAVGFGLIQLANYLINSVFQLEGAIKTVSIWIAIIFSLFLAVLPFSKIIIKINDDLDRKEECTFPSRKLEYEEIKGEAIDLLNAMIEIKAIKILRQRHGLSLVEAKGIVDSVK